MVEEDIKNQEVEVPEPKKRKYGWVGMILLLAVIGLGIFLMFKITELLPGGGIKEIGSVFSNMDYKYFAISIALAILIPVLVMVEYGIVSHSLTKKVSPKAISKTTFVGKYYDFITPFSTGGQPMQIHTLHKHGYDGATSSAIILIRYSVNIICWLLVGLGLMIAGFCFGVLNNPELVDGSRTFLLVAGIVGICINLLLPLSVLTFVVFPRFANGSTKLIIKIGAKLHIVKDPVKSYEKAYKTVHDFRMCFRTISKKPVHFILLILVSIIEYAITFALPFFVIMSLKQIEWANIFDVSVLNVFSTFAVSFIPTPGNAGGMEISSALAFQAVAPEVSVYAVLIWRFFTYYIYILIGIFISIYDIIKKAVKAGIEKRREKKAKANEQEDIGSH